MALSQKHEGKCLVPWFCSAEWHFVKNKIFGPDNNTNTKREALKIINIWKARTPLLSRGVEGTLIILEALVRDRSSFQIYDLKLLWSASIMRFLNICAAYNKNQGTFYSTANKMKIPEWLINMRHTIAHGQNLPSIDMLEKSLKFCLKWLYQEYWKPAASEIKDFIDDTKFASDKAESLRYTLQPIVSNYCYITLLTHPKYNITYIRDISDETTRDIFLKEMRNMTDSEDINSTTELSRILEILWDKIERILKDYEDSEDRYLVLAGLIAEEESFFGGENKVVIFEEENQSISKDFTLLWEKMLSNFKTEMIGALIEKLSKQMTDELNCERLKFHAASWILEIGLGLEKCLFTKSVIKELSETGSTPKKSKLQSILNEKLAAKYGTTKILNLNPNLEVPDVLSDCSKFQKIFLKEPTDHTYVFINKLLDFNDILKLPQNKKNVLDLINAYTSPDLPLNFELEIHNVEELVDSNMDVDDQKIHGENSENKMNDVSDDCQIVETDKIWRRVTEINFEKCPIGILPWQTTEMNPLLV